MARRLDTARTGRRRWKPSTKTAKRSPVKNTIFPKKKIGIQVDHGTNYNLFVGRTYVEPWISGHRGAESLENLQDKKEQWVSEIQLSGTFRLGGKGFASLITPRGNFWVEEGKSSSGYKLIELDTSQSQPSALIQKGDQQAWIGFRSVISLSTRVVGSDELEKRLDDSGKTRIMYVKGENEPFTGMGVLYNKDGSKNRESVYENGKLHGTEMRYTKDGRRLEIPYVDGKKHGMQTWYYETGNKKEETPYVDGKRHGTEVEYLDTHINGHKWRVVDKWRNHLCERQNPWHAD